MKQTSSLYINYDSERHSYLFHYKFVVAFLFLLSFSFLESSSLRGGPDNWTKQSLY